MQIFVKTLNGKTITLNVEKEWSVTQLHQAVEDREGVPVRLRGSRSRCTICTRAHGVSQREQSAERGQARSGQAQ